MLLALLPVGAVVDTAVFSTYPGAGQHALHVSGWPVHLEAAVLCRQTETDEWACMGIGGTDVRPGTIVCTHRGCHMEARVGLKRYGYVLIGTATFTALLLHQAVLAPLLLASWIWMGIHQLDTPNSFSCL